MLARQARRRLRVRRPRRQHGAYAALPDLDPVRRDSFRPAVPSRAEPRALVPSRSPYRVVPRRSAGCRGAHSRAPALVVLMSRPRTMGADRPGPRSERTAYRAPKCASSRALVPRRRRGFADYLVARLALARAQISAPPLLSAPTLFRTYQAPWPQRLAYPPRAPRGSRVRRLVARMRASQSPE